MNVLVCDEFSSVGVEALKTISGVKVDVKIKQSEDQLVSLIPDYEIAIVRSATQMTARIIDAGVKLQVIARAGMGYDNIDIEAATKKGVVVMNTPGSNSVTTAEHTIAMMMSLARNIPQAHSILHTGKWEKKGFMGTELLGKTLGIVGLGNVGREVAKRAKGLKMDVIGYDPYINAKAAQDAGATLVSLDDLWTRSDFITLHTVLDDSTRHLIDAKAIAKMKDRVRIINCARGGLIDEAALIKALQSGKVAGAALDVFEEEPLPSDHPLIQQERVVLTPHLGASTDEAQEKVAQAIVDQLRAYIVDGVVLNGVNVPNVSREVLAALTAYLNLAQKMGALLGQLRLTELKEVQVELAGEIAKFDLSPISSAVLCGFMRQNASTSVNFVNAAWVAKERGVRVVESKTENAGNFVSLLTVKAKAGTEEHTLSGTVFGRGQPRLIQFDRFYLEVTPAGHLVILENEDRPGVVGAWGTILGKNKINISQMQVALAGDKKQAMAIVNVDSPVPAPVLEELRKVPGIRTVRQVNLS